MSSPRVAIIYDRVTTWGGAEQVLLSLHDVWPGAPLYTSVYRPTTTPWADGWDVRPSWLQHVPFASRYYRWLAPLMPYAFESLDLSNFDVVISVTSAEAKGVLTKPHQLHVCYMLTPTRYLWSHRDYYLGTGVLRSVREPFVAHLADWDLVAATRPDVIIPISEHVANRVRHSYEREPAAVIYPPVDVDYFSTVQDDLVSDDVRSLTRDPYVLMVGRPVGYKWSDEIVHLFEQLKHRRLVIVGSERSRGRTEGSVVELGHVDTQTLRHLYQHAEALVFPQEEDFGIVPVEAQAACTPVLALKAGGALETVVDGVTGMFLKRFDLESLRKGLDDMRAMSWYPKAMLKQARKFEKARFERTFKNTIEELWQKHQT